jgi:hypothetical protein
MEHEVYYLRRRNLGNYEHSEASMRINVRDAADVDAAFEDIKERVHRVLELPFKREPAETVIPPVRNAKPMTVADLQTVGLSVTDIETVETPPVRVEQPTGIGHIRKLKADRQTPLVEVTDEALGTVLMRKADTAGMSRIKALIREFGADFYGQIPQDRRLEFIAKVEAL